MNMQGRVKKKIWCKVVCRERKKTKKTKLFKIGEMMAVSCGLCNHLVRGKSCGLIAGRGK